MTTTVMTSRHALTALFLFGLIMGMSSRASAVEACDAPAKLLENLRTLYGEVPTITATMPNGQPLTITVSPSGSWTMLAANQGLLCALAGGEHWAVSAKPEAKPETNSLPAAPALLKNGLLL